MPWVVDVLLPLPLHPFRYLLPPHEEPGPLDGRVAVPWQGGVRIGIAVGVEELPAAHTGEYRELIAWLDRRPFLAPGSGRLLLDVAAASATPPGTVLAALVPVGLREELVHEVTLVEGSSSMTLDAGEWVEASQLGVAELDHYRQQGMVQERVRPRERMVSRLVPFRPADESLGGKSRENQRVALARLEELEFAGSAAELARDADVPESAVRALVKKGYAGYRDVPAPPASLEAPEPAEPPLEPLGGGLPQEPVVLVSGGLRRDRLGLMLPTIEADLRGGKSVLVLAPEAAYLHQAASLLASRLPVLVLSGEASDEQRLRVWEEAASGRPLVLLGTYAALLAPLANTARIVVTEAGSGSYKLLSGPRLFVPAAAHRLATLNDLPLVLSDALPSPEMRQWAGPADGIALPRPAQRVFVSDLSETAGWPLGSDLARVLRQVQERGRQAVLLAPRRGFSAAVSCQECSLTLMCPNCDLALRYHRKGEHLRCHQCGYQSQLPEECPECGNPALEPGRAAGTEWVAGAVARLVPELTVARYDRDHQDDLSELRSGAPGVLVATTAVLRLHPLPNVSLIGVTLLDTHLNVSDFRAAEESLRFLLQLPELAPGRRPLTVVQTFQPEHPAVQTLLAEEADEALEEYGRRLIDRRKSFGYPPYGQLAKIQLSSKDRTAAEREATRLVGTLATAGGRDDELMGPVPAPVMRIRGQYSYLVYLRGKNEERFEKLLQMVGGSSSKVRVRVDVDPRDVAEFLE